MSSAYIISFFVFLCFCKQAISYNSVTPPDIFPTDNKTFPIIPRNDSLLQNNSIDVPLLFPKNDSKHTFSYNSTLLNTLLSKTIKPNETEKDHKITNSEVADLLEKSNVTQETHKVEIEIHPMLNKEIKDALSKENKDYPEFDVGLIQPNDDDGVNNIERSGRLQKEEGTFIQEQWPALLGALFAFVAVMCYIGLLVWRRFLEQRYGTREMLINEEETANYHTDIRNFEIHSL